MRTSVQADLTAILAPSSVKVWVEPGLLWGLMKQLSSVSNGPELGRQLKAGRQDQSARLSSDPGWQVSLAFST